ncbi:vWA domain-containing protein [Dyadobacter fanqingshengii]|uniref:VWA domain-containing protein n=1 Tax=Dyadobacter fanqingshengii TaxID=2906443 RepID=A0A9X1PEG8_9BACT|nr:VWA domain-containing protein [Dyadobacter fanqingshengii]MCF0043511.1 VWA domain-containing protein [Dyadobacter fanqingshengii]USJ34870.1 VWA domain-containing protein [Dyadobacter fanqingshengii]
MEKWFSLKWFGYEVFRSYEWVYPYFLYLLPFIPILFWLRNALHRKHKQRLVITYSPVRGARDWQTLLRFVQPVSVALGIALILVALARPQVISERTDQYSEGIDIMLLLDISDSMMEKDLSPNRLEAAKLVARQFIKGRLQDRIGLIVFAGEAVSLCPLTTDYELLYGFLDEISPAMVPTAGTAIGSALAVAVNRMRETPGESKVAILISDGDNTSGNLGPATSAQLAHAFGVKVYTISVGKQKKSMRTDSAAVSNALVDETELKNIAGLGNGKYFRASDNSTLEGVFKQIDQLEKVKSRDVVSRDVTDFYRIYLYWAVLFLLIAIGTKSTFMANILED